MSNISTPLETAIETLGEIGGPSSQAALGMALDDWYYRVRLAALRAIEKLDMACAFKEKLRSIGTSDVSKEVADEASKLSSSAAKTCTN